MNEFNGKKIAFWGAGLICRQWLQSGFQDTVDIIIDNSMDKNGERIEGVKVVHPDQITDWHQYFIIIVSNYWKEIAAQLKEYGLAEKTDFIAYPDYYARDMKEASVVEGLEEICLPEKEDRQFCVKVHDKNEYDQLYRDHANVVQYENALNTMMHKIPGKRMGYPGFCKTCNSESLFTVDYLWTDGSMPAWRETVFCPKCNCNSRMRFMADYLNQFQPDSNIYIYEYVTTMYHVLSQKFKNIIGSEYLGEQYKSGEVVDGVMHQDALNLSFEDGTFDAMVSADVYEHVADYHRAFEEAYRCLKKGGKLIFSIPIFKEQEESVIRTKVTDGKLEFLLPKVYHGNPLSQDGSLVFTDFGWDVIEGLKAAGFKDAYGVAYFSAENGYLGDIPVIFEAVK